MSTLDSSKPKCSMISKQCLESASTSMESEFQLTNLFSNAISLLSSAPSQDSAYLCLVPSLHQLRHPLEVLSRANECETVAMCHIRSPHCGTLSAPPCRAPCPLPRDGSIMPKSHPSSGSVMKWPPSSGFTLPFKCAFSHRSAPRRCLRPDLAWLRPASPRSRPAAMCMRTSHPYPSVFALKSRDTKRDLTPSPLLKAIHFELTGGMPVLLQQSFVVESS